MLSLPIIAGVIASVLHVISGPDHLAAVTPIAMETRRKVWRIGFYWGTGHLFGMLVIGVLFFLFRHLIPIKTISKYSEQLVAIILIFIGLWSLCRLFYKEKIHSRPHIHTDTDTHIYVHSHDQKHIHNRHTESTKHSAKISSFGIGVLHGLAGIAHFIVFLPALGFQTKFESMQYIMGFAMGTLLAMSVYTFLLGRVTKLSNNNTLVSKNIRIAGCFFVLAVGFYWLVLSF